MVKLLLKLQAGTKVFDRSCAKSQIRTVYIWIYINITYSREVLIEELKGFRF